MQIDECVRYRCLGCSLPKGESTCYNPGFRCMADAADSIARDNLDILLLDAETEGYSFLGVEDYIHLLNHGSPRAYKTDGRAAPFSDYARAHPLVPNTVADDMDFRESVDSIRFHHGRGSQFSGSKCPISVLYSNMDPAKVEAATGRKIKALVPAIAGTYRHHLVSVPGVMHEEYEYSGFRAKRSQYTEKRVALRIDAQEIAGDIDDLFDYMEGGKHRPELWDLGALGEERRKYKDLFRGLGMEWRESGLDEYVLKGTADCLLRMDGTDILAVLDWKRARFYKNAFGLQMTGYALAVQQMSGTSGEFFIINVINNFLNQAYEYRLPRPHITHVEEDDPIILTMKAKFIFLHTVMRHLAEDRSSFLALRDEQRRLTETKEGDAPASICEVLYSGSPCVNLSNDLCDIVHDFAKEGGDIRDFLIDGFQLRKQH